MGVYAELRGTTEALRGLVAYVTAVKDQALRQSREGTSSE